MVACGIINLINELVATIPISAPRKAGTTGQLPPHRLLPHAQSDFLPPLRPPHLFPARPIRTPQSRKLPSRNTLVGERRLPFLPPTTKRAQYFSPKAELMVIVGFGVVAQLTYLLPSWFVLLLAAQVLAFWDILVGLGLAELAFSAVDQAEASITKFLNLIPRYQE